jgi:hypothetical protein
MSSCANIVNRLQSDVCLIKDNWSYIELMASILKIDQAIFLQSPLLVYLVPTTPNGMGVPLTIEASSPSELTTTTYSGLIVTDPSGSEDCVVFTTETLLNFGQRTSTGLFEMTDTLPIVIINADPSILLTLSYSDVVSALQSCASATDNHTVSCQAFDALNIFLRKNFGIKNLTPSVAACFYDYFNQNANRVVKPVVEKEEPVVYLPVDNTTTKEEISVILPSVSDFTSSVSEPEPVVRERTLLVDLYETCAERAYPFEPFEPFEPVRDIFESDRAIKVEKVRMAKPVEKVTEIVVRHIEDSATTTTDSTTESSSNDAIEAKLRALLEATETSEVTRTE